MDLCSISMPIGACELNINPFPNVFLWKWRDICTRRNIFGIIFNQTEVRFYLPFPDWFGTANGHCPFLVPNQSENGKYSPISVWFDKISKKIPLCVVEEGWNWEHSSFNVFGILTSQKKKSENCIYIRFRTLRIFFLQKPKTKVGHFWMGGGGGGGGESACL